MKFSQLAEQHLDIKTRGVDEVYALCPFHEDSKPSFAFNTKSGLFICYACGEKGTVSKLLKKLKLDEAPSPTIGDLMTSITSIDRERESVRIYPESWLEQFKLTPEANKHLRTKRHLKQSTIETFKLGWNGSRESITIPLHDRLGHLVGINQRFTSGVIKYRYPLGFRRQENLYTYHQIEVRPRVLFITEGCFDALAFWNIGLPAVAIYGSSMSEDQNRLVRMLLPRLVVIAMDNDRAGRDAAQQVSNKLVGLQTLCMAVGEEGDDPGGLSASRLRKSVRTALSASESTL